MTARLIVYTRARCPLCDALKDELGRLALDFEERDITTDADWYRRYRNRIPVIVDPAGREYDPPFDAARLAVCRRLWG